MTIAAEIPRLIVAGTSAGTLGPWDIAVDGTPWTYESETELSIYRYAMADAETRTLLTQGTDYDISGVSGAAQFTLTSPQVPLLSEERLLIERHTPVRQIFTTEGPRFNHIHNEEAHDRTVRILQELKANAQLFRNGTGVGLVPDFGGSSDDVDDGRVSELCVEVIDSAGLLRNDGLGNLDWRPILYGTGWRQEIDGTITMYGRTLLLGGATQRVFLPIASSVDDYGIHVTPDAGLTFDPLPLDATFTHFDLTPASATGIANWKIVGARL